MLRFRLVLPEHVFGTHVQINLRGRQVVVAQDPLESGEADALPDRVDRERMPKDMGRRHARDATAVRDALHDPVDRAAGEADGFMDREVVLEEGTDAAGNRDDATLRRLPERAALSEDRHAERAGLPLDLLTRQRRELGDPEPCVDERPDNEFLFETLAGVHEAGRFLDGEWFAAVLVGHGRLGGAVDVGLGKLAKERKAAERHPSSVGIDPVLAQPSAEIETPFIGQPDVAKVVAAHAAARVDKEIGDLNAGIVGDHECVAASSPIARERCDGGEEGIRVAGVLMGKKLVNEPAA